MADSTTKFKADISQLKSAMQQAQKQVSLANSEFKKATAGLDNWSQSATGLSAKLKQLDTTLSAQKTKLNLLKEEYEKTTAVYGENSAAALRVKTAMNNQEAAIAKTEKEIEDYTDELQKAEKYGDGFADSIDEMNDAADNASNGFTVMKGALASLVADGVRLAINALKELAKETVAAGMNFEQGMAQVAAISGATSEELDALTEKAKEMGATTKFSATESAAAFNYMAMAGWETEDMLNGIEGIMNLAAASGADLATTSDIVTDALTAMGYSAGDAGKLADVMAAASSNANTNVELMGKTFQYAAPIVGALGYSMEDTAVAIGLMANAGIKGDKAGTALRSVLTRLSAPPKECATAMEELGISLTDAEGNMKSLDDVMGDLRVAFADLDETQKTQYAKMIAGQNALSGLLAVVNAAPEDYAKLTAAVKESEGAAQSMADTMNDTVEGQLTLLKSQIEGIQIQVYDKLRPALRAGIDEISKVLEELDWDKVGTDLGNLANKAIKFGIKIIENGDGIIEMLKAMGRVAVTVFAVEKVTAFAKGILLLTKQIKAYKAATDLATASQKLLNVVQAAAPIGLVVAAVAGLVTGLAYLIAKNKQAAATTQTLTDEQLENIKAVDETAAAYKEMKAARDESVESVKAEYSHLSDLAEELDFLVDANGRVKTGYEDRVNFILTTLNDALGTEMTLTNGVIENYREEKQALEDLIETKKAQAVLSANEEAYTEAIKNRGKALEEYVAIENDYNDAVSAYKAAESERQRLASMTAQEYADSIGLVADLGLQTEAYNDALQSAIATEKQSKAAVGDLRMALSDAEENYVNYQATIKNYEGLSSAIISGDVDKISEALENQLNDFITAETGTEETLRRQVQAMEANYEELRQAVANGSPTVTQEMVNQAASMVKAANDELSKFEQLGETGGIKGGEAYAGGMKTCTSAIEAEARALREQAERGIEPSGKEETSGENFGEGYIDSIESKGGEAYSAGEYIGDESVEGLDDGIESNSPSRRTYQSGVYFAQGFINGMSSLQNAVYQKAFSLAKSAVDAVKAAQKEGSPSKLTYQSGVYFVQGYMNGIVSQEKSLQRTVKYMVKGVVTELAKLSKYNFDVVAENASTKFVSAISAKSDYMFAKLAYQNEQKLKEFDAEIDRLESVRDAEAERLQAASDAKQEAIQTASNARLEALQEKYDAEEDKERRKALKKQIDAEKDSTKKLISAEQAEAKKLIAVNADTYKKLIDTQNQYKEAYNTASEKMLSELSSAMNEYQSKAQKLIDDTINGITEKYDRRYDDLLGKQDSLVSKLKSAGDLFEISGAGIMTVNDLNEQTRQIKSYTNKLKDIKSKVSGDLFDEIASYDMKEGAAFIDRLLKMDAADLQAYNKAYSEKMQAAEKAGDRIYKADFKQLAADYQKEIKTAFKGLDAELEKMGSQAVAGFIKGFRTNTNYMSKEVKVFVRSMIDTFKEQLKISSPSKVMAQLGDYTGEGFVNGLKATINSVKQVAGEMVNAVATPLDGIKTDLSGARSSINPQGGGIVQNSTVVNNYNMVQNNTSPKSLSALDTFQARRQQIALIKAATGI